MTHVPPSDRFDLRAAAYSREQIRLFNEANERYPRVRETERRTLIERLDLRPGLVVCDVGAGGGYLSDGIYAALGGRCRIICVENSPEFAASLPDAYEKVLCSLSNLELDSSSVDRVACLTGIHHQEDKAQFFREAVRVLKPGGVCGVGDVQEDTPVARFLNEAVDRHSELGHDGMFTAPGELASLMEAAGLERATEDYVTYTWDFPDHETLVSYCRILFRMTAASLEEVESELHRYLQIETGRWGARIHWGLVFASARKPDRPAHGS